MNFWDQRMVQNDGDIVRGLGFVTMYAAWVEEAVDDILRQLSAHGKLDEKTQRRQISQKLKLAAKLVNCLQNAQLDGLPMLLLDGVNLFERRNEVIHGRIYAFDSQTVCLRSGWQNGPARNVTAAELYALAIDFYNYRLHLISPQVIRLPIAVTSNCPS